MTESITTECLKTAESRGKPDILEFERLRAARLETDPFDYLVASGVIGENWTDRLISDYPKLKRPGSFPLSAVRCGSEFYRLIQALDGKEFREIVEDKFSIQLGGRPTMFTVRGVLSAEGWKDSYRHGKQDDHRVVVHESRVGACRRQVTTLTQRRELA